MGSMKKYFAEVFLDHFAADANPADVLLDAISFDDEDNDRQPVKLHRMIRATYPKSSQEFGEYLAKCWIEFKPTVEHADLDSRRLVAQLPVLAVTKTSWGEQILVQMQRSAVQMQRDWLLIVGNNVLLVFALFTYCTVSPKETPEQELVHPGMALFLVALTQGIASLRIFGGDGRSVI